MIYIDPLFTVHPEQVKNKQAKRLTIRHGQWCHMIADTEPELVDFAVLLGLRTGWIQKMGTPEAHFDLVPGRRAAAVKLGAKEVTAEELVNIIRARRGLKPLTVAMPPQPGGLLEQGYLL